MAFHRFSFALILVLTWPVRWLPYPVIHRLGRFLGSFAYLVFSKFRKRALSNLALASSLNLSESQIRHLAKASLQNLMITCLEYAKFASEKQIGQVASCVNPETASALMQDNKPVIFFCGHQANWEVLFLEGTTRMPGVAIGRPIKNTYLYQWILGIRQKFGGKIIAPSNAIREGLRGLKRGCFLGVVGDQGMPDSGYSSPFLGRIAWTTPMPAILSHRTGAPIIVATTKRQQGKYLIHYSDPIWPSSNQPPEQEIDRLMRASLSELEKSIAENPGQWLWSHNRWKQQTPEKLKPTFRHESILIILPQKQQVWDLSVFREIYPREFITVFVPQALVGKVDLQGTEFLPYTCEKELFRNDFRFKLVFNFTECKKIKSHFKKLSAFHVATLKSLQKAAGVEAPLSEVLKKAVLKSYAP